MIFTNSNTFYNSPHENGVLLFVLGILFILTIYHFLLFFQHKGKTYIYYATYTLLLFTAYFTFTKDDFLFNLTKPVNGFFSLTHVFWVWLYNIAYYYFVFRFLNFKKHHQKKARMIKSFLFYLLILGGTGLVTSIIKNNDEYLSFIYLHVYIPLIILLTLYCFYLVYKTPEKTKNYILIGSFILFLSSVLTILIVELRLLTDNQEIGFLIFYIGIIIENIFFSLGLGLRQKEILLERDNAKNNLILKLQENKNLKEKINQQLQEKVNTLNNQISLKEELETLKLTAFRSQMNPHFIFNALNSIKHYIINNEQKNAVHYLNKFSKLVRKILEVSTLKEISLQEELETMDLYMTIENIRFSNEIDFKISVDQNISLNKIMVPPLVLQPFLENALWHGLSSKKGKKIISLNVKKTRKKFVDITIDDNGIGREASAKIKAAKSINRKSLGISLTKERLENFFSSYTQKYLLKYQDIIEGEKIAGTKVVLKMPLS